MIRMTKYCIEGQSHELSFNVDNKTGYTYRTLDFLTYNEIRKLGHYAPGRALNLAKRVCELIDKKEL